MTNPPILEITGLQKYFPAHSTGLFRKPAHFVRAVDSVSFALARGEILGLVGESGCGKSTLVQTLMGLEQATAGQIMFEGRDITHLNTAAQKTVRRQIQMVFQDPFESLNPLLTVGEQVAEPLLVHGLVKTRAERLQRATQALKDAGLNPAEAFLHRRPYELSGGQRQRVVIAGALVLAPTVLLADEPVSMLDVSVQAEILNLLVDLRRSRGISIIFITHDLSLAAYFVDRIAVMYLGRIVEIGPTAAILSNPQHPYTRSLLSVIPVPSPNLRRKRLILQGDPPNPLNMPAGCRFHPRCPLVQEFCRATDPALVSVSDHHSAACLLLEAGL
jgi:oligopeptide/dipeptide ABC transporter ATP-binding protein